MKFEVGKVPIQRPTRPFQIPEDKGTADIIMQAAALSEQAKLARAKQQQEAFRSLGDAIMGVLDLNERREHNRAIEAQSKAMMSLREAGINIQERRLNLLEDAAINPKPPGGYRTTKSGELEPIPGGPADTKLTEAREKRTRAAENLLNTADSMIAKVDSIMPRIGITTAGFGSILRGVPATPAKDLDADIKTLQANIGFKALAEMRDASKTGGALGNISDKENELLQATVASLDTAQGRKQLKKNMLEVRASFERVRSAARAELGIGSNVNTGTQPPTPSQILAAIARKSKKK